MFPDISIWTSNQETIDVFVTKPAIDEATQRLDEANIQYEVIVEDYQKVIDEENPSQAEIEFLQSRASKWIKNTRYSYIFSSYVDWCN